MPHLRRCLKQLSYLVLHLHSCPVALAPRTAEGKLSLSRQACQGPRLCGLLSACRVVSALGAGDTSSPFSLSTGRSHVLPSAWDMVLKEAWGRAGENQPSFWPTEVQSGAPCAGQLAICPL